MTVNNKQVKQYLHTQGYSAAIIIIILYTLT